MININYNESIIKRIGDFGFEITEIVGRYDNEDFKISLSYSPRFQNREARLIKGNLTREQLTEILIKFSYADCRKESIQDFHVQ